MNPFLVIGGVAVTVATAAIGILAVPGWIESAHDSAAQNDLAQIAIVQESAATMTGRYVATLDELEAGVVAGTDIGARLQPSDGVALTLLPSESEFSWCAVAQSASGAWFARSDSAAEIHRGETKRAAADAAGCPPDQSMQLVAVLDTTANGCVDPGVRFTPIEGPVTVDWGDGTVEDYTGSGFHPHTYAVDGRYEVTVEGRISTFGFAGKSDSLSGWLPKVSCVTAVTYWGENLGLTNLDNSFAAARNLTSLPGNLPRSITALQGMFNNALNIPDVSGWDTSNVTSMRSTFYGASTFNQDLSSWDTSSVTDMHWMFYGATQMAADLSGWDVSNVVSHQDWSRGSKMTTQPAWVQ